MLSTTLYAAPRPGGCLLYLRVPPGGDVRPIMLRLLTLPSAPACGCQHRADGWKLVLIWADTEIQRAMVYERLAGLGTIGDWPGRLAIESGWQGWHGVAHTVQSEDEASIDIPAWLERLQAEASL